MGERIARVEGECYVESMIGAFIGVITGVLLAGSDGIPPWPTLEKAERIRATEGFFKAEREYKKALDEAKSRPADAAVGSVYEYFGVLEHLRRNTDGAVEWFGKALKACGGDGVCASSVLGKTGIAIERRGDSEQAETMYRWAMTKAEGARVQSKELALALELLSVRQRATGRAETADRNWARAGEIRRRLLGESWPDGTKDVAKPGESGRSRDLVMPVVTESVEPKYSDAGRMGQVEGRVILGVLVGRDGKVVRTVLRHRVGYDLDEEAVAAVRRWKFRPATVRGEPREVAVNIEVNFRLME
jgi:TonB family protein